jgi:thiol:disulfide interchange protein
MFFVLALGLGLPYLLLGAFSSSISRLPRSGEWMVTVRKVFGLVLIGMALYFLMPLLGAQTTIVFVVFFAASALYLVFWESGRAKPKNFAWVLRTIGAGALVVAVFMALPKETDAEIGWQPYTEEKLASARREGKPVIIDAYADWCIPCKELDKETFTDDDVRKEAETRFVTLKLDLTGNDDASDAGHARKRFAIRGVPTIIFMDPDGRELEDLRLEGFEEADDFLERMRRVPSPAEPGLPADAESKTAPDVSLKLLDGGTLDLASTRGKVLLLDFWATWCVPCIAEIPAFNALHQAYKDRGLEIIAISLDEEGADIVRPFVKKHGMNYTIALGDPALAEKFGVTETIPVTIVVDRQGRIKATHVGVTSQARFEADIKPLLEKQ